MLIMPVHGNLDAYAKILVLKLNSQARLKNTTQFTIHIKLCDDQ